MAKKVVATFKSGKSGAYSFKEEIVHNDHIADFLKSK
jgi:hypothetical protein